MKLVITSYDLLVVLRYQRKMYTRFIYVYYMNVFYFLMSLFSR